MDSEDRLARMQQDGILTERQAEMLREGMSGISAVGPEAGRPSTMRWVLWSLLAIAIAIVAYLVFAPGADEDRIVEDVTRTLNEPGGYGEMNRSLSGILAAVVLLIVPVAVWVWLHNALVSKEERVFEAWAQTESNFQRRADLVPALIETVSRYMRHERETLTDVTEQRGAALAKLAKAIDGLATAQRDSAEMLGKGGREVIEDETALAELMASQTRVDSGIRSIIAVAEQYPALRASDQFLELQAQLEGTENRINIARMRFNEAVRDYNGAIRRLPGSLVAGVGNFKRKAYFRSETEARDAPEIQFR